MDAVDILKICFRRWYVMLPILIGAAGVSYQLVEAQETTYTAAASYGLVAAAADVGHERGGAQPPRQRRQRPGRRSARGPAQLARGPAAARQRDHTRMGAGGVGQRLVVLGEDPDVRDDLRGPRLRGGRAIGPGRRQPGHPGGARHRRRPPDEGRRPRGGALRTLRPGAHAGGRTARDLGAQARDRRDGSSGRWWVPRGRSSPTACCVAGGWAVPRLRTAGPTLRRGGRLPPPVRPVLACPAGQDDHGQHPHREGEERPARRGEPRASR